MGGCRPAAALSDAVSFLEIKKTAITKFKSVVTEIKSIPNPLHILEQNLLPTAVIEFRGSAVGVTGDSLSGFQGAVIFQKNRDAGRPE
jgi:hypothetical protein